MTTNNNESKSGLTDEQRQKLKKYAVFALMFVIFGASMYVIFAPSAEKKAQNAELAGFNTDIPMPSNETIIGDKRDAYEQEQMKEKQAERMKSLADFSSLLGDKPQQNEDLSLIEDKPLIPENEDNSLLNNRQPTIQNSVNAYRDINRNLGSFYEMPQKDPDKEHLQQELDELKSRLDDAGNQKSTMDNQLALMEKSFQMASKYLPVAASNTPATAETTANEWKNNKVKISSIEKTEERCVSALPQDLDFVEVFSKERNLTFNTLNDRTQQTSKNTISACIHDDQTIRDGQNVRLRLLENVQADNVMIPRNTLITGTAKIQGERLNIFVASLEYEKTIIPVEIQIYDNDGQPGIFIPTMQELDAGKEILANMGTSVGTSISLSTDAKEQFLADMGRSIVQGTSQLFAKKVREVKVYLKAGYQVLLLSNNDK